MQLLNLIKNKYHHYLFYFISYIYYILLILAFIGLYNFNEYYLKIFKSIIIYYVCIYLLVMYNPYIYSKKILCHDFEFEFNRNIIFSSSILLILTTGISDYISYYFNPLQ